MRRSRSIWNFRSRSGRQLSSNFTQRRFFRFVGPRLFAASRHSCRLFLLKNAAGVPLAATSGGPHLLFRSTPGGEESLDEFGAFGGENSFDNFGAVIQ